MGKKTLMCATAAAAFASAGFVAHADEAIGFDLGLGYGFDNGFRLEGVGGYADSELTVPAASYNGAPGGAFPAAAGNLQVMELMFNGIYDFNREGALQPYVGL